MKVDKKTKLRDLEKFKETHLNHAYENLSFTIILVKPETSGNIGAISRLMKNFGFENLVIFNPKENVEKILSYETCGFAMHGKDVLFNAKIIKSEYHIKDLTQFLKNFDLIIATTAKGKRYTNLRRLALFPQDLQLPLSEKLMNVAILFGKESRGLTNKEIDLVDIVLRIPTDEQYPSLNLSHSCGIILYELFKKIHIINVGRGKNPVLLATKEDKKLLYNFIVEIINMLKIRTYKENNVLQAFKNVFERAFMSKKELSLILGLFSKINSILKKNKPYED
jgi:TrmH family RNA methyltransferase